MSEHTGKIYKAVETKCKADGDEFCEFLIEEKEEKSEK